jgi:electron transfer flavoprotein beta subunit
VRIVVVVKQVPDLVEELEVAADGTDVDREFLAFKVNEFDDHALEEALLLKDATGAEVIVVALDDPDVEQTLYTALAKGADKAVKFTGVGADGWVDSHTRAALLTAWLRDQDCDLVLTGVQAADDLDGQLAPLLGAALGLPHASVVVGVEAKDGAVVVHQEFSGGMVGDLDVQLPAVLGVQAAREAPRYAPISRIRQAQQAGGIDELAAPAVEASAGITVRRLYAPEQTGHAEMLTGSADEVAGRIVELIRERGLGKG